MSAGPLPRLLDLRKLTDHGGQVSGITQLNQLPRLAEFAGDGKGEVAVELRFFRDEEGRRCIEGKIHTRLELVCQRCLLPVVAPIDAQVRLVVVWSEEEIRHLPEALEPWLGSEEPSALTELLEEEILLALPLVALHDDCQAPATPKASVTPIGTTHAENPFSVLAKLKKRQD